MSENFTSGVESEAESEKSMAERPKSNEFSREFFFQDFTDKYRRVNPNLKVKSET